jgi:hypothetical protein
MTFERKKQAPALPAPEAEIPRKAQPEPETERETKPRRQRPRQGLDQLVRENWEEIAEGLAYFLLGKNGRKWEIISFGECSSAETFEAVQKFVDKDPKSIMFNAYENAWVGFNEYGEVFDGGGRHTVVKRLRNAYNTGFCVMSHNDIDYFKKKAEAFCSSCTKSAPTAPGPVKPEQAAADKPMAAPKQPARQKNKEET